MFTSKQLDWTGLDWIGMISASQRDKKKEVMMDAEWRSKKPHADTGAAVGGLLGRGDYDEMHK